MCSRWELLKRISQDYGIDFSEMCTKYNVPMRMCTTRRSKKHSKHKQDAQDEFVEMEEFMDVNNQVYLIDDKNNAYQQDQHTGLVHLVGKRNGDGLILRLDFQDNVSIG